MQPAVQPNVGEHLVGHQLDMCFKYDMEHGTEAFVQCQGDVLAISDGTNMVNIGHRSAKYKKGETIMI
eukprot:1713348-Ditylum_brightwellii.AAC.1